MELKDYTNAQFDFTMALKLDKNDKKKQAEHLSKIYKENQAFRLGWLGYVPLRET